MRKIAFIFLALLFYAQAASAAQLVFWMSTYFGDETFTRYEPIRGHFSTSQRGALTPGSNYMVIPVKGSFVAFALGTNNPNALGCANCTDTITLVKNGVDTSATCTIVGGSGVYLCKWTGNIAVLAGDQITMKFSATGSPIGDTPLVIISVFDTGGRNWPFTAKRDSQGDNNYGG